MKAAHAGLLVLGAVLAGALAVEMTQPQPLPEVGPGPIPEPAPVRQVSSPTPPPPVQVAAATPKRAPVSVPVSVQVAPSQPEVYVELMKPAIRPAIRKDEPILTATAAAPAPPATSPPPQDSSALFVPPKPYEAPPAPIPAPEPTLHRVTLQTGMVVPVRLMESLSSDRNVTGDTFHAALAEPLVVDGLVIAERGAQAGGRVVDARDGRLQLELANISTSDGQKVAISTDPWSSIRVTTLRSIFEALAGGRPLGVPSDTLVRFRLATRVTITERRL